MKAGMRLVVMRNIGTLRKLVNMNQVKNHRVVIMSNKLVMVKKTHQGIRKLVALNKLVIMKTNLAVKMSKETMRKKRCKVVMMKSSKIVVTKSKRKMFKALMRNTTVLKKFMKPSKEK